MLFLRLVEERHYGPVGLETLETLSIIASEQTSIAVLPPSGDGGYDLGWMSIG